MRDQPYTLIRERMERRDKQCRDRNGTHFRIAMLNDVVIEQDEGVHENEKDRNDDFEKITCRVLFGVTVEVSI